MKANANKIVGILWLIAAFLDIISLLLAIGSRSSKLPIYIGMGVLSLGLSLYYFSKGKKGK